MSILPVAQFLTDFGSRDFPVELPEVEPSAMPVLAETHWTDRVDEAYARGLKEGRDATEAQVTAELDQQRQASEAALAAAREAWTDEAGPRIAGQITAAIAAMEERIAEAAARVLRPFMVEAVRNDAIRQLRTIIKDLIRINPALALDVSGPEDLLDALRAALPDSATNVTYVVSETTDIEIKAGASLLETSIGAWLANCEGQNA